MGRGAVESGRSVSVVGYGAVASGIYVLRLRKHRLWDAAP